MTSRSFIVLLLFVLIAPAAGARPGDMTGPAAGPLSTEMLVGGSVAESASTLPEGISDNSAAPQRPRPDLIPAKARAVLQAIQEQDGRPPPGYVGGRSFQNRERRLPRGRYREYDVNPKRRGKNRGAERIVIEQRTGKAYYTDDHYRTFIPMN
jgi:guanyl-specific ribonuclease Sa